MYRMKYRVTKMNDTIVYRIAKVLIQPIYNCYMILSPNVKHVKFNRFSHWVHRHSINLI